MAKAKSPQQSPPAIEREKSAPPATLVLITRSLNPGIGGQVIPGPMRRRVPKGDGSSYELRLAPGEILALFTQQERDAFAGEIESGAVNTATLSSQQADVAIATLLDDLVSERIEGYCEAIRTLSSQLIEANIQPEFRVDRDGLLIECDIPSVPA